MVDALQNGSYRGDHMPWGATPLAEAAKRGDMELVGMLLEAGADPLQPDARPHGTGKGGPYTGWSHWAPIDYATDANQDAVCERLLGAVAEGGARLRRLVLFNDVEGLRALVQDEENHGRLREEVESWGASHESALHFTARTGNVEMGAMLVFLGGRIEAENGQGLSASAIASQLGNAAWGGLATKAAEQIQRGHERRRHMDADFVRHRQRLQEAEEQHEARLREAEEQHTERLRELDAEYQEQERALSTRRQELQAQVTEVEDTLRRLNLQRRDAEESTENVRNALAELRRTHEHLQIEVERLRIEVAQLDRRREEGGPIPPAAAAAPQPARDTLLYPADPEREILQDIRRLIMGDGSESGCALHITLRLSTRAHIDRALNGGGRDKTMEDSWVYKLIEAERFFAAKLLLEHGAKADFVDEKGSFAHRYVLKLGSRPFDIGELKLLGAFFQAGVPLDAPDSYGRTVDVVVANRLNVRGDRSRRYLERLTSWVRDGRVSGL